MNPISILVVDDATETAEVIAQCLGAAGHSVTCASGGRAAIALLQDRYFDLVITDLLMPDADGMQVIMATREHQPEAQVLAMSGGGEFFSAHYYLRLAGKLGARAPLMKPFSQRQLFAAVESVFADDALLAGAA